VTGDNLLFYFQQNVMSEFSLIQLAFRFNFLDATLMIITNFVVQRPLVVGTPE
jgi:hypothetical protein